MSNQPVNVPRLRPVHNVCGSHSHGDAGQHTCLPQPVERAESLFEDTASPAQVGQILIALQADHDHSVGAVFQNLVIAWLEGGAVGKDQKEPVGIVTEELRNARQQEWLAAGNHERHHPEPNRFIDDSVPISEVESWFYGSAGYGPNGSCKASGAAQIAFGCDAENEKGRHLYPVSQ